MKNMKTTLYILLSPFSWVIKFASKLLSIFCALAFFVVVLKDHGTNNIIVTFSMAILFSLIYVGIDKFMKYLEVNN
jgi:hypothetical protein